MLKRIALFFALGLVCRAADHHHYQGMAVVTYQGKTWEAAFRMEDFDPIHTPELGMQALHCITLTPTDGK